MQITILHRDGMQVRRIKPGSQHHAEAQRMTREEAPIAVILFDGPDHAYLYERIDNGEYQLVALPEPDESITLYNYITESCGIKSL